MPKQVRFDIGRRGQPPPGPIDSDLKEFNFYRISEINEHVDSPSFWCFDEEWKLRLTRSDNGGFGLFLIHCGSSNNVTLDGEYTFVIEYGEGPKHFDGSFYVGYDGIPVSFGQEIIGEFNPRGHSGILSVRLEMMLDDTDTRIINLQGQDYKLRRSLCNVLSDSDTSDISFDVKGQIIHAHLAIF